MISILSMNYILMSDYASKKDEIRNYYEVLLPIVKKDPTYLQHFMAKDNLKNIARLEEECRDLYDEIISNRNRIKYNGYNDVKVKNKIKKGETQ